MLGSSVSSKCTCSVTEVWIMTVSLGCGLSMVLGIRTTGTADEVVASACDMDGFGLSGFPTWGQPPCCAALAAYTMLHISWDTIYG